MSTAGKAGKETAVASAGPASGPAAGGSHQGQPVRTAGRPPDLARGAVILVHGRGATAESLLGLAGELGRPELAWLAPQAAGHTWYPYRFLAPLEDNEPGLSSGLAVLDALVEELAAAGIPPQRTVLLGFSQGACLALEYAARHPRRYAGVVGWTGGLIGPPGSSWGSADPSSAGPDGPGGFDGTPVFLGAGDPDPHVPWWRVEETADHFRRRGAQVTLRRYPGMPHTVNDEELTWARDLLTGLARR